MTALTALTGGTGLALLAGILLVVILRKPLLWLGKLLLRTALGLGFLALWAKSGILPGLALGVNGFNALVLGVLGLPGLGLLLLLRCLGT